MAELYAKVKPDVLQPPEAPDGPLPKVSSARASRTVSGFRRIFLGSDRCRSGRNSNCSLIA
jgi:hypothetical protein